MPVIRQSQALYPFWGTAVQTINGLDPLGMQTTSEATYSLLLPGVSNLTNRIRYYGFYCWLLKLYFDQEGKGGVNSVEQFRFIRRAELLIALLMQDQHPQVTQITGSRYAANWLGLSGSSFNLADGADHVKGANKELYWKYKSGAFGQYYLGPMKALDLVFVATDQDHDELYKLTDTNAQPHISGQVLAEAFEATVAADVKDLFYQSVRTGKLEKSAIPDLAKYFTISTVDPTEQEGQLYSQLLRGQDYPALTNEEDSTFHRRNTLIGLLDVASKNHDEYSTHNYLIRCYRNQFGTGDLPASDTKKGWYTYLLNEYWQYACGSLLWGMLAFLNEFDEPQYLPEFVRLFVGKVISCMDQTMYTEGTLGEVLTQFSPDWIEDDCVQKIQQQITAKAGVPTADAGFYLLFQLFINNADCLQEAGLYMYQHQTRRDGNVVEGLQFMAKASDQSFSEFIEQFLYRYIINRHRLVAMRKMGNGYLTTHKFIIDEHYIRYVNNFIPRFTSPRMYAVTNLLSDLQFLDKEDTALKLSCLSEFFTA